MPQAECIFLLESRKEIAPIGAAEWQPNLLLSGFSTLCIHVFGMSSSALR